MIQHQEEPTATTPKAKLEPRFSLPDSTPRSSKTELVIGGVRIYIYGLDDLQRRSDTDVGVLYLAHNRTRTYQVTEGIAHEVLHSYRNDGKTKSVELIAITMNMRNHGDREISPAANLTWSDGNDNHGMDLLSLISGSAQDFKLILDYLPSYFPQFKRFYNIMAGVSLGGHTAWRMASMAQEQLHGLAMIVGCPNLSALLLSRLGVDPASLGTTEDEMHNVSYDILEKVMNEEQRRRWPRPLAELVSSGDRKAADEFPADVRLLLCNGRQDPLVPARHTAAWVRRQQERHCAEKVRFFVQDNTGHSCTKEMVGMLAAWLGNMFEVSGSGA
ncbi:Alpha/Beta hydrolase protein [Exophiala viscosa]|uniref:Alpha/Beta hydrolase protein n=1 Tax=Exophiala viscosa TaxID=2486360 RepID=A0AAN6IHB4_9EURO|nr:Alpha/Beta hydrolase protein [Exophiala viscosa]